MAQGMEPCGEAPVFIQMENSLCEVTSEVEVHKRAQCATQNPLSRSLSELGKGPLLPGVLWEQRDGAGGALRGWISPRWGEEEASSQGEQGKGGKGKESRSMRVCDC